MIIAIDVHYYEDKAKVAGVLFKQWNSETPDKIVTTDCQQVAEYQSGQFYKRELPCILQLLNTLTGPLSYIVIDGYVYLGSDHKPGLGMHLYQHLAQRTPIIGVAKNAFTNTHKDAELLRGNSQKPLYISSVGIELQQAKTFIATMKGRFRIPTLLKEADRLCRQL